MNLHHVVLAAFLPATVLSLGASADFSGSAEAVRNTRIRKALVVFEKKSDEVLQRRARVVEAGKRFDEFSLDGTAHYRENDSAADLVEELKYTDLVAMEAAGLRKAQLEEQPWSGDYWPVYRGMIAKRYGTGERPSSNDWKKNYDAYLENTASSSVDSLSPAEKYDLLVGDGDHTLTAGMWEAGRPYQERYNKVEPWMGLCHGWAPASFMVPRPAHAIEALAADGQTRIRFFPDDIKALATLLWANAPGESRFIGGRCQEKKPELDENGRIRNPDCFDTNPGTWHMAVVNQLGHAHRSFVIDSAYDYQVWNQPLYSYRYTYFNPQTREPVASLEQGLLPLRNYEKDIFRKYRSAEAVSVVGVAMDVTYMIENSPKQNDADSPEADSRTTVTYLYDLELDDSGHIIGGEWYEKAHPDFLWTPTQDARAVALGDRLLQRAHDRGSWDGRSAMPELWQQAALPSSKRGEPLAHVVETLVSISKAGL